VGAVLVLLASSAQAAEGEVSLRGAYYKEKSTRVVQPMIDGKVEVSEEGVVDFHGLVDSITSASAATGSAGQEFTEERYEGGAGYTHTLGRLQLGGSFRTSTESDYDSYFLGLHGALELAEKNTVLSLNVGRSFDTISNGVSAGGLDPLIEEKLQTGLASLSLSQLLSPQLLGVLTYDFIDAHGYQANLYRRVSGGDVPEAERVPDLRLRHAVYLGVRGFFCPTLTTVVAGYRLYVDDWGILAHTGEVRAIQELAPGVEARVGYRLYTQGAADFFQDRYTREQVQDESVYITDDEKLSSFTTQTFGLQGLIALAALGIEGSWSDVRIDLIGERILQDNRFGNAWSFQVGLVVPVEY
jgi:hypothetical protein